MTDVTLVISRPTSGRTDHGLIINREYANPMDTESDLFTGSRSELLESIRYDANKERHEIKERAAPSHPERENIEAGLSATLVSQMPEGVWRLSREQVDDAENIDPSHKDHDEDELKAETDAIGDTHDAIGPDGIDDGLLDDAFAASRIPTIVKLELSEFETNPFVNRSMLGYDVLVK
ncbi:uncharacterized protein DSM5745_03511 [Aspergillus mulundensis]|uniref:Uncharacterized protein n=1 Tax=Aspergillus mulundensis TaxID=1810919 RepID=A0A3D8SKJ9_9EURO|nr:hypothetical protein DSM5745_03511 [Aspergillus mulundensis]RDW86869.1 hypothetical protein DSM5745_03511 [Aspergillus mulundensis]